MKLEYLINIGGGCVPAAITSKVRWGRELDLICDRSYLSFTKPILQEGNSRLVGGWCAV